MRRGSDEQPGTFALEKAGDLALNLVEQAEVAAATAAPPPDVEATPGDA